MALDHALLFLVGGISGGTATLSYRIAREFQKHAYEVYYVFKVLNDSNNYKLLNESRIRVVQAEETKWEEKVSEICNNYKSIIIITYAYKYFDIIEKVRKKNPNVNGYLYVVNTRALVKVIKDKCFIRRCFGMFINEMNKKYIEKMYCNNHILFMDQASINTTCKNSSLNFPDIDEHLFLLPYDTPKKISIIGLKRNIIITMARISFPFKGYIIGLIDTFSRIANKYDAELWIIGDGESMPVLKNKIEAQLPDIKKRIKLFYNISYDKIGDILKQGKVFVGMGTGILDATAQGVPCIAIKEHDYKCLGKYFFKDNPKCVGFAMSDDTVQDIDALLQYIFTIDSFTYIKVCEDSITALKSNYSVEAFYDKLTKMKNGNEKFNVFENFSYRFNKKITQLNRLLHNKFI